MAVEMDGHPDNVAASLLGGLQVACLTDNGAINLAIPCSDDFQIVFAVPTSQVATKTARSVLPKQVSLDDAAFNVGRVALLVAAFATLDYASLHAGMEDRLHQRHREVFVPQMRAVFQAARDAGAWSVALSGSGPTIAAFCTGRAEAVGDAMKRAFADVGVDATVHPTTIDFRGVTVVIPD